MTHIKILFLLISFTCLHAKSIAGQEQFDCSIQIGLQNVAPPPIGVCINSTKTISINASVSVDDPELRKECKQIETTWNWGDVQVAPPESGWVIESSTNNDTITLVATAPSSLNDCSVTVTVTGTSIDCFGKECEKTKSRTIKFETRQPVCTATSTPTLEANGPISVCKKRRFHITPELHLGSWNVRSCPGYDDIDVSGSCASIEITGLPPGFEVVLNEQDPSTNRSCPDYFLLDTDNVAPGVYQIEISATVNLPSPCFAGDSFTMSTTVEVEVYTVTLARIPANGQISKTTDWPYPFFGDHGTVIPTRNPPGPVDLTVDGLGASITPQLEDGTFFVSGPTEDINDKCPEGSKLTVSGPCGSSTQFWAIPVWDFLVGAENSPENALKYILWKYADILDGMVIGEVDMDSNSYGTSDVFGNITYGNQSFKPGCELSLVSTIGHEDLHASYQSPFLVAQAGPERGAYEIMIAAGLVPEPPDPFGPLGPPLGLEVSLQHWIQMEYEAYCWEVQNAAKTGLSECPACEGYWERTKELHDWFGALLLPGYELPDDFPSLD